jgi:hypothetical protein
MGTRVITDAADLREGDVATLECTVLRATATGRVTDAQTDSVIRPPVTTVYLDLGLQGHSTPFPVSAAGGWRFVSATREVVEPEPGQAGTATVRGVAGVRVMRMSASERAWASPVAIRGNHRHSESDVTDFVPDEAPRPLRKREHIAHAMHDDYLPPHGPRLNWHDRLMLADAVLALLNGTNPAPEPWPFKPGDVVTGTARNESGGTAWLDAAPVETKVRDAEGDVWEREVDATWRHGTLRLASKYLIERYGPLTVVSVPGGEPA